jgi:hypothetical protein
VTTVATSVTTSARIGAKTAVTIAGRLAATSGTAVDKQK